MKRLPCLPMILLRQEALFSLGAVPIASQTLPGECVNYKGHLVACNLNTEEARHCEAVVVATWSCMLHCCTCCTCAGGHQIHIFLGPGPPPAAFLPPQTSTHSSHGTTANGLGAASTGPLGPGVGLLPSTSAATSLSTATSNPIATSGSGWVPAHAPEPLFGRVYPSQMPGFRGAAIAQPVGGNAPGRSATGSRNQPHSVQGAGPSALGSHTTGVELLLPGSSTRAGTSTAAGVVRPSSPHPRLRMASHPFHADTTRPVVPPALPAGPSRSYVTQALPVRTGSSPATVPAPGIDDQRWAQQQAQYIMQAPDRQPVVPAYGNGNANATPSGFPVARMPQVCAMVADGST
jgi:hypothetical protein